jgi:hypothetical protein
MKLHELKTATLGLKLPDLNHINDMGKLAFRMGFDRCANPHKIGRGHDSWVKGWDHAKRAWEDLLRRNGADGKRVLLWMS